MAGLLCTPNRLNISLPGVSRRDGGAFESPDADGAMSDCHIAWFGTYFLVQHPWGGGPSPVRIFDPWKTARALKGYWSSGTVPTSSEFFLPIMMKSKPDIGLKPLCLMCLASDHSITKLSSQTHSLRRAETSASIAARPLLERNSSDLGGSCAPRNRGKMKETFHFHPRARCKTKHRLQKRSLIGMEGSGSA